MHQFTIFASLLGGAVSFIGFCIAYRYDPPVAISVLSGLCCCYAPSWYARLMQAV